MRSFPDIHSQDSLVNAIHSLIEARYLPDYVYSYPPRQSFLKELPKLGDSEFIIFSLSSMEDNYNLYLHFPFCNQICGFCNLYAVGKGGDQGIINKYIDVMISEFRHQSSMLPKMIPKTLYFGGGTPSLLTQPQMARIINAIEDIYPGVCDYAEEICIEVDPATLTQEKSRVLAKLGFNRISLGAQSFQDLELQHIGRPYGKDLVQSAVGDSLDAGIKDVCVDLIVGLPGQTFDSWKSSVLNVLRYRPPTICTYQLTSRQATGFTRRNLVGASDDEKYKRYEWAQSAILDAGYEQETNVRYVIPNKGGYRQKVRHWDGGVVHGFGAGARTYTPYVHYVNGYSAIARKQVLRRYLDIAASQGHFRTEGALITKEESARQKLVLSLERDIRETERIAREIGISEQISSISNYMLETGLASVRAETPKSRDITISKSWSMVRVAARQR